MEFLITCEQGVGLWCDGELTLKKMPQCRGLSWNRNEVFLAYRREESRIWSSQRGILNIDGLRDVHQILWARRQLWITDTGHDSVVIWDDLADAPVSVPLAQGKKDTLHLNSLWRADSGQVWALKSGLDKKGALLINVESQSVFRVGPLYYHNLVDFQDKVWCCVKWLGTDVCGFMHRSWDQDHFQALVLEPGSFTRGLAFDGDTFWVGCSKDGPREERSEGDSQVLLVDRDLNLLERIDLPDTGQIREVRLLDGDLAHHGLPFPGQFGEVFADFGLSETDEEGGADLCD